MAEHAARLLELATQIGALTYGDYTLSWGGKSRFYFDGRLLTLEPEGAYIIGQVLLPYVTGAGATAVGGPTLGADPMVAAIAMTSHMAGQHISGFIVRKETKGHGTGKLIEGPLTPGSRVAIVDDTCSTGGSLFQTIAAAEDAGCRGSEGAVDPGPARGWLGETPGAGLRLLLPAGGHPRRRDNGGRGQRSLAASRSNI